MDRSALAAWFAAELARLPSGVEAIEGLPERLAEFSELLFRWSGRMNLTGHPDLASVAENLVLDSVALAAVLPEVDSAVDLGSGAGIPGIPFGLARPRCRVLLVEARERRHHFQRAALRALGTSNVSPVRGRAEDLEPAPADLVMARAFAAPDRALAPMLRWARPGALLALPGVGRSEGFGLPAGVEALEPRYYGPADHPQKSRLWLGRVRTAQEPR